MCAKRQSLKDKRILFSSDFYSDMEAPDMLYACEVRAPQASGTIEDIVLPELDEGYTFLSCKDIPGKKSIKTLGVETPVFCTKTIAYQGEPVGLLVGPREQRVHELASLIQLTIREQEEAPAPEEEIQAERTVTYGFESDEAFEAAFKSADYVVDGVWKNTLYPISYGEPTGAFAFTKGTQLHVCTSSQWLSHLRKTLSEVTGTAAEKIVITRTPVSDLNTNVLWRTSVLSSHVALAALKTGKPVKLVLSREEQDTYMDNAAPVSIIYRSAVSKNGEIGAMDITIDIDAGSKNPFAKEILDRIIIASCSIYRPKKLRIQAQAHRSSRQPFSINLSTIDSQAFFAIENQMQRIAEKTGFTPVELRLLNWKQPHLKKHDTYPFLVPCEKVRETIEAVCRSSDFLRKYTAYKLDESDRYINTDIVASPYTPPLRGIALACAYQGSSWHGTTFPTKNTAIEATLEKDGSLSVHALPPSSAVWHIWKRLAHEALDIDESKITLDSNFALGTEPEAPETITTNIGIYTSLFQKCLKTLKTKQHGPLPVTVKKAQRASTKEHWNKEAFSGLPFSKTAFAAAVVELELDPATYREKLLGIWIVVNGGTILDVRAAEGAVKNSVQQTLAALIEDDPIAYTNVKLQFVLSNEEPAPIGDIVPSIIPAAFSAALSQAVAATITSLPIKTDTLYIISAQARKALDEILAFQKEERERAEAEKAATKAEAQAELTESAAEEPTEAGAQSEEAAVGTLEEIEALEDISQHETEKNA